MSFSETEHEREGGIKLNTLDDHTYTVDQSQRGLWGLYKVGGSIGRMTWAAANSNLTAESIVENADGRKKKTKINYVICIKESGLHGCQPFTISKLYFLYLVDATHYVQPFKAKQLALNTYTKRRM